MTMQKTIATEFELPSWRYQWAAQQLGVASDASPEEVRAAFLRRLPEVNFVPPSSWRLALLVLSGKVLRETGDDAEAARQQEDELRSDIEAFAREFWQLPLEERQQRCWNLIQRSAPWPCLLHRLKTLQLGLSVGPIADHEKGSKVGDLIGYLRMLFVLRPVEHARTRQEILTTMKRDIVSWSRAARDLQQKYPTITVLEPGFIQELSTWQEQQSHLKLMLKRLKSEKLKLAVKRLAYSKLSGGTIFVIVLMFVLVNAIFSFLIVAFDKRPASTPISTRRHATHIGPKTTFRGSDQKGSSSKNKLPTTSAPKNAQPASSRTDSKVGSPPHISRKRMTADPIVPVRPSSPRDRAP